MEAAGALEALALLVALLPLVEAWRLVTIANIRRDFARLEADMAKRRAA